MHLLAAALTAGGCLPYFILLLGRPATPGGAAVLGVAVFGICAALASLWWVRRTHRYAAAIALLCWPVFLALSALMAAQGGARRRGRHRGVVAAGGATDRIAGRRHP